MGLFTFNRRLIMKMFNQFFSELNEYLKNWSSVDREEWLRRISAIFGFISILIFLIFIWKNHQPDFIRELPKIANRLLRYFLCVIVFLIIFSLSFHILKFFFLRKK